MSSDRLTEWKSMYGDVVWAKAATFPWWPCYIYDPNEMPGDRNSVKKAMQNIGKQYTVYFYGDESYGYAPPKNLKPYNEENRALYSKQSNISKKYENCFKDALELADTDVLLPKENRVAWHIPVEPKSEKSGIGGEKKEVKRLGRKPNVDMATDDYFDAVSEEGREGEEAESKESSSDESDIGSSDSEPVVVGRKRKTHGVLSGVQKREKVQKMPVKPVKAFKVGKDVEVVQLPAIDFDAESRTDRLKRLMGILRLSVDFSTPDESRAIKTIEKIVAMKLSFDEMKDSGVAMLINELRKHSVVKIAECAKQVRDSWKEAVAAVQKSSAKSAVSSAPVTAPQRHHWDFVAKTAATLAVDTVKPTELTVKDSRPKEPVLLTLENLPEELTSNPVRFNAVRLLLSILSEVRTAAIVEACLLQMFGDHKAPYLEAVARLAAELQRAEHLEVREKFSKLKDRKALIESIANVLPIRLRPTMG